MVQQGLLCLDAAQLSIVCRELSWGMPAGFGVRELLSIRLDFMLLPGNTATKYHFGCL